MEPSININEIVSNVIGYSSHGLKVNNNPINLSGILHLFYT